MWDLEGPQVLVIVFAFSKRNARNGFATILYPEKEDPVKAALGNLVDLGRVELDVSFPQARVFIEADSIEYQLVGESGMTDIHRREVFLKNDSYGVDEGEGGL
ncbi:hypothetical protein PHISP_03591 [Aspergillus sp. HF37]|nr:hypothetical protein PHISP_03591 [Aspergillus sp. HF37]